MRVAAIITVCALLGIALVSAFYTPRVGQKRVGCTHVLAAGGSKGKLPAEDNYDDVEYISIDALQDDWLKASGDLEGFDEKVALMNFLSQRSADDYEDEMFTDEGLELMDAEVWIKRDTTQSQEDSEEVELINVESLKESWNRSGKSSSSFAEQEALLNYVSEIEEAEDGEDIDEYTDAEVWIETGTATQEDDNASSSTPASSSRVGDYMSKLSEKVLAAKRTKEPSTDRAEKKKAKDERRKEKEIDLTAPLQSPSLDDLRDTGSGAKRKADGDSEPVYVPGKSVGIDLGTTYSSVALIEAGSPVIVPVDGSRITPSVVGYPSKRDKGGDGVVLVGELARRQLLVNPKNTFASVKRVIGRKVKEVTKKDALSKNDHAVKRIARDLPRSSDVMLSSPALGRTDITPEEISSKVLKYLLDAAQSYLTGEGVQVREEDQVTKAVITVPAYFLPSQCEATEKAGIAAGLKKVKLLREPEAAALAYGLTQEKPQIILVFDLGGGTFDCSVLEVGGGFVEVIATSGDSHLGGDDFDDVIVTWLLEQLKADISDGTADISVEKLLTKGDWLDTDAVGGANEAGQKRLRSAFATRVVKALQNGKDPVAWNRLHDAAVTAKCALSSEQRVEVEVPFFLSSGYTLSAPLTRKKFNGLSQGLLGRILKPLREVAIMSGVNLPGESGQLGVSEGTFTDEEYEDDEDETAGEQNNSQELSKTAMKKLQSAGRKQARAEKKRKGTTTKELRRLQKSLGDSSLSIFPGGQVLDGVIMVGGATRIPAVQQLVKVTTGADIKKSRINPDEAVSLGAAILAGILDGDVTGMTVMSAWQAEMYRALGNLRLSDFEEEGDGEGEDEDEGKDEDEGEETKESPKTKQAGSSGTLKRLIRKRKQ